ncbi:hypothetical protein PIB30_008590 [Stylosanthes scabra]|uniref:Uncharacterized protein n=1 Tax=Stylosanthes scabra TaxID=79078 RepID=A0ABU6R5C7_9FABA|nr:hypothetical protein [Stylosanthes scabra]
MEEIHEHEMEVDNKQVNSISTKCVNDDRCTEEVIHKTQWGIQRGISLDRNQDNAIELAKSHEELDTVSCIDPTLPPEGETLVKDSKKEDETDDEIEDDDEENEDLEEARNTLQVCARGGITFNEDEDVVLAKLRKKKKNKGKCRNKKMQLHRGSMKLSTRLLMSGARSIFNYIPSYGSICNCGF